MSDKMVDKKIIFDDGDDGVLEVDITSPLTACMVVKTKVTGIGLCAVSKGKNPKIFEAVHALYRAIEIEQNC